MVNLHQRYKSTFCVYVLGHGCDVFLHLNTIYRNAALSVASILPYSSSQHILHSNTVSRALEQSYMQLDQQ